MVNRSSKNDYCADLDGSKTSVIEINVEIIFWLQITHNGRTDFYSKADRAANIFSVYNTSVTRLSRTCFLERFVSNAKYQ